ncbi:MAG: short-chain dehydrogenase [Nitrosomonadaceae bacterium]|nr:short-chain dehydrogenase [Nitrosomonadaceae bacterium]|tara:strand:- start:9057 stop:9914 length:858 start_codon:yes stop_codon:yes gene_type:complete
MAKHLNKKSILITGCSSGIGLEVADGLKFRGYRVFATGRQKKDIEMLNNKGFESLYLDLNSSKSIKSAVDEVLFRTDGTLYALFNNGGYGQPGAVEDLSREAIRAQFETNLFGTMELTNLVIPFMRKQGYGRIIQNSSFLGFVALPYRGAYISSKYALEGLTDTLRLELGGTHIHVSLIESGPILTKHKTNSLKFFKKYISTENSPHSLAYKFLEDRLTQIEPQSIFTLHPNKVLEKVIDALESRKPKNRYYITFPAYLFAACKRVLPNFILDKILLMASDKGRR